MSSALVSRILAGALLVGTLLCARAGLAGASSLEDILAGGMAPSSAAGLLGPITSAGRKGWDCKPEHVAQSQHWQAAELPAGPHTP
jgi:hypothetical protein